MHSTQQRKTKPMRGLTISLSLALASLGALSHQTANAQPGPGPLVTIWDAGNPAGSGTADYGVASNWSEGTVPNVDTEDAGIINGGGTAQVDSVITPQAGSIVLGQGAEADQAGTLEILSGGSLTVASHPTFPADGSVRVGQNVGQGLNTELSGGNGFNGTGTLRVLPGGTLTSESLTLGGTVDSSIILGGAAAGTATVNTGAVTLGRTTRVIGPSVDFTSSGMNAGITFQGNSVLIPEITGATHSTLKTEGAASLGGMVQLDFNGVSPEPGDTWDIVDAASVGGAFASVLPDPDVPLGAAQRLTTQTVSGGDNGQLVQVLLQQMPVLTVDRDSGAVDLTNPGATGATLDGYSIGSASGGLSVANWESLEANPGVGGGGWTEANPTSNRLSELRASGTSTIPGGAVWPLGEVFQPAAPTEFGEQVDDLVFQYNDPETQTTVDGIIEYSGSAGINNLVLFVDPDTGNVKIRNTSPFSVEIDGYTIASDSGSLNSDAAEWTSLQDQPGEAGPNWVEANPTDSRVSELMSSGTTTLSADGATTFDLGGLFDNVAGVRDLEFQFLLSGESQANTGVVLYEAAPPIDVIPGDYNNDGVVDAGDYVLWRDTLGSTTMLAADGDGSGVVDGADYDEWVENYGTTSGAPVDGAAAAPEPGALILFAGALPALAMGRRRKV